jgi:hypothetical protein
LDFVDEQSGLCAESPLVGCSLPSLSAGESVYITIVAIVDATATGKVSATATVTGGGVSSSASATNVVDLRYPKPADLALTVKTASGGRQGARWTWRIFNLGPGGGHKAGFRGARRARWPDRRVDNERNVRSDQPGRQQDHLPSPHDPSAKQRLRHRPMRHVHGERRQHHRAPERYFRRGRPSRGEQPEREPGKGLSATFALKHGDRLKRAAKC